MRKDKHPLLCYTHCKNAECSSQVRNSGGTDMADGFLPINRKEMEEL